MSKIQDDMRALLGRYSGKKTAPAKKVPAPRASSSPSQYDPTNRPLAVAGLTSYRYRGPYGWIMVGAENHEDALHQASQSTRSPTVLKNLQVWDSSAYVAATPANDAAPVAKTKTRTRAKLREPNPEGLPPDLRWSTVEGTKVLTHPNYPNYVAARYANTAAYDLIQLDPREGFAYKVPQRSILLHFAKRDAFHKTRLENERDSRQREEGGRRAWEDQPGYYVVPGDGTDYDGDDVNATGPYDTLEEAVEDAYHTMAALAPNDPKPVLVIEAANPREAAAGRGHVWWQDEVMRGPPVDPRQQGFGF